MKNLMFLTLSCLIFSNVYASTNKYEIDDHKIEKLFAQASEISFVSADTTKRCEESALLGIANASMYKTDIWFIGGLGAGCLTGGCTIGIVPVFALTSNTQPLFYPKNIDRFCYRMAL